MNKLWLEGTRMSDYSRWYYQEYAYGERTSTPTAYIQADDLSTVSTYKPGRWRRLIWWVKELVS